MNTYDCPTVCLCTSLLCLPRDEANHCFYFLEVLSMTDFLYLLVFISLKVCFSPSFHARHVLWGLWNPLLFSHAYQWCIHLLKTNLKSYLMILWFSWGQRLELIFTLSLCLAWCSLYASLTYLLGRNSLFWILTANWSKELIKRIKGRTDGNKCNLLMIAIHNTA